MILQVSTKDDINFRFCFRETDMPILVKWCIGTDGIIAKSRLVKSIFHWYVPAVPFLHDWYLPFLHGLTSCYSRKQYQSRPTGGKKMRKGWKRKSHHQGRRRREKTFLIKGFAEQTETTLYAHCQRASFSLLLLAANLTKKMRRRKKESSRVESSRERLPFFLPALKKASLRNETDPGPHPGTLTSTLKAAIDHDSLKALASALAPKTLKSTQYFSRSLFF